MSSEKEQLEQVVTTLCKNLLENLKEVGVNIQNQEAIDYIKYSLAAAYGSGLFSESFKEK